MGKQRILSFFASPSKAGQALGDEIENLALELDLALKIPSNPTPVHVALACCNDDVVIFDGSIEEEGHSYEVAYEQLKRLRHVLIIGRTPLPLNFLGLRGDEAPNYPTVFNNEDILAILRQELPLMPKRSWLEKGLPFMLVAQSRSTSWAMQRRKEQGKIFISYRSRYKADIQKLQEKLKNGGLHQGQSQTMFFFPPGSLAFEDEVMAAMRRWQILSIIRDYIYDCEEFWIYKTDDYLDSWWTRGELATFIYRGSTSKRIRLYDAKDKAVRDVSPDELPVLTKGEHDRMARWFANTDPMAMGAESTIILGNVAQTPLGKMSFFNDPVWKEEFQHYPVVQCSSKQCNSKRRETPEQLTFDVDGLLWMHEDNLFPVESQQLKDVAQEGMAIVCPRCGASYKIVREPLDRYLYLALPVGTGPKGKNLQSLPVYRAKQMY